MQTNLNESGEDAPHKSAFRGPEQDGLIVRPTSALTQARALSGMVVMGVSGCGKSSIAQSLAAKLGWEMVEGDQLHPPANIARMSAGIPLEDADRLPWLDAIAGVVEDWRIQGRPGVVTCSSLKKHYRERLTGRIKDVCFVYLAGTEEQIMPRLSMRTGHFMPTTLLRSQFDALEEPGEDEIALYVSLEASVEEIVSAVIRVLKPLLAS
ncbi:gluconokinase [Beijerinckia indica]|nr:gluconokinase [Beijerinckia indica]